MKKWLNTGKKTLSVIMAIMMLMSAWVWVAPTEASAATGKYDVQIKWYVGDDDMDSNGGSISLWTKGNNGTDSDSSATKHSEISFANGDTSGKNQWSDTSMIWTNVGFPYKFTMSLADTFFGRALSADVYVYVRKNGTTTWSEAVGSFYINDWGDNTTHDGVFTITNAPVATTFNWSNTPEGMTCPKSGSVSQTVAVTANDQFGVQMYDPVWSVKGSACGTTGISVSTGSNKAASTSISLTNGANNTTTTDTQTGTVTATWGSASNSKTFTITDTTYDVKFSYDAVKTDTNGAGTFPFKDNDNSPKIETKKHYHGDAVVGIPSPQPYYDNDSYYYTFKNWYVSGNTTTTYTSDKIPAATTDKTYIADYNKEYKPADYTALDAAIAAGKALQNDVEYASKYTAASRAVLNEKLNNVPADYKDKYGIVSQDVIDNWAAEINAACNLDLNTFAVIFLDKDGAILLYEKDVEYKQSVTAPEYSAKYYDSTNHYTFSGWDTAEYTSVIDDLVIQPVFTAEAHTFTTSTVESTCVQKGATKYTCSCGYSYIDGETDFGDHKWKSDFTVDLMPNCTVAGSKSIHCSLCNAQSDITEIPALGHQWGTVSSLAPATCDKNGINTRLCDACGVCEHTIIPALEHDYVKTTVPATCTAKGYDEYVCQRTDCDHSYRDNFTNVIDHSYPATGEVIQAKACGVTEITKFACTACGYEKVVSGETGTHDALDDSKWNVIVEDTCEYAGYRTQTCSKCNNVIAAESFNDITDHDYETATTPATCTQAGYTVTTCKRADCGYEKTTVIQPTGHKYEKTGAIEDVAATCTTPAYKNYKCDVCADTKTVYVAGSNALLHDFNGTETIIDNATCTADGKKTVKCTRCDATTEVIIPKLGHNYGEWDKTTNPATNDKDGTWTRKCENCGDVETLTIPKGGHNFVEDTSKYVAPTCNKKGQRVYKCNAHDNCIANVTVELDYAQHTIAIDNKEATCTEKGHSKTYCSVCNKEFNSVEIPVKAHNFKAQTAVAPTCTTSGYTPYKCSVCDFTYNVYDESKPAIDHTYTSSVTTEPGCTTEGVRTYTCTCGDSYTAPISPLGHNYTVTENEATCTTAGTEVYTCACGDTYTKFIEAAKGHSYGNWEVVTPATADKYGVQKGTCSCGDVEYALLAPIGNHTFTESITKKPTCTEKGEKSFTCSAHTDCSANYTEEIPATGHTQKISYSAPTCSTTGSSKVVCSVCSAEILSETIPATGIHDYSGEGEVTNAPTCEGEGTMTYTCTICKTETKTEKIPAKGHKLTTTVTDAKCGEKGSVVTVCENCDDPDVQKTTELAAKGHIWNTTYESKIDATCEADGSETYKCQNCDKTNVVVLPKLGHNWDEWKVTPSTNNNPGSVSRKCLTEGCDETESVEIPAGGHELVVDTEKSTSASCSAEGTLVYKCKNHTDCGITVSVNVPMTQHTVAQRETLATCKVEGKVEAYCSKCNVLLSTETIPVKAHEYKAGEAVAPTCTTSGYTPYTCSCGDTYNKYDASKPATGHTLKEGASTASCTTGGDMTLTCENCTYNTTVKVPAKGHDYVKQGETISATCNSPATETYKCIACGDTYTKYVSDKTTAHTYIDNWTVVKSATESSIGYKTRECTVCGQLEVATIEATGEHAFTDGTVVETKAATCTENGYEIRKCSKHDDCGKQEKIVLYATGHKETLDYKAATCTAEGYSKIVCSVKNCTYEADKTTIPALGHLYGEGTVTPATCNTKGSIAYECTRTDCNEAKTVQIDENANAHQYETVVTQPTCYKEGTVVTKCKLCDNVTTNKELPMIEHTWNAGKYAKETDKPTCEADGTKTYTCNVENCGATKTETVAKLGHDWNDWVKTDATNSTDGEWKRTCKNDAKHVETVVIPKGDHQWDDGTVIKAASCTETGTKVYKCKTHTGENACGVEFTVTLDKLQHETEVTYNEKATCEADGKVVTKCKTCETQTVETIIPATGHTLNDGVKTPATCTSEGKIVYSCTAENCNYTKEVTLDKLQHNYEADKAVAPTCTTSGYTPYKCADCDSNYVIITANATGHNFDETVAANVTLVPATCQTEGSKTVKCVSCDATNEVTLPKTGHSYAEVTDKETEADCTTAGTKFYDCEYCESTYTEFVEAAKGHKWSDTWTVVRKATENEHGVEKTICTVDGCDAEQFRTTAPIGNHSFKVETQNATCTADGLKTYTCTVPEHGTCSANYTEVIPATGHTEALAYSPATCTAEGSTKIICSECDVTIGEEKVIPKLGHTWSIEKITPATCKADGSIEYKCFCGATDTAVIPVDDTAHNLKTTVDLATCKEEGKVTVTCENGCTYKEETTIPKLQHNWGEWTVVKASTNEDVGLMERACLNGCTEKDTVEIPAGGHVLTETARENSTCIKEGFVTFECKVNHTGDIACGVGVTVKLPLAQHTLKTESEAATCSKEGFVKSYCSVEGCGKVFADVTLTRLQHEFEEISRTEADCNTSGYITYKCKNCDETYDKINGDANGHKFTVKVSSTATCTNGGTMTLKCADCDATMTASVPELGHNYELKGITQATCAAAATETYKCSRCEASYTISVGEKKAHEEKDWSEWTTVVEPTETTVGCKTRKCNVCGQIQVETIEAIGEHRFADGEVVADGAKQAATCTENGFETRRCSVEHTPGVACSETSVVTIPATGHTEETIKAVAATCEANGSTEGTKCSVCDTVLVKPEVIAKLGHAWNSKTVTPATCVAEGKIEYTCDNNCDEKLEITIDVDTNAHNLEKTTTPATCTENGKVTISCKNEGCKYNEEIVTPAKGHEWNETASSTDPATCDNTGLEVYKCNNCTAENKVVIPALGHDYEEKDVAPTCITSGHTVYTCKRDAAHTYTVYNADEPASGHDYAQVEGSSTADCTKAGKVTLKCADCGDEITADVPALGHSYGGWTTTKNPTAEEEGTKRRDCDNCDAFEEVKLPKLGHNMVKDEVASTPATCTIEGTDVYVCDTHSDCGYTLEIKVATIAHVYDNGVVTTPATCTTDGVKTLKCDCGASITEVIPKTGHTLSTTVKEADCKNPGYVLTECGSCNYEIRSVLAQKPHDLTFTTVNPGCETEGSTFYKCGVCQGKFNEEILAPLGHDFSGTEVVINDATCTVDGSKTVKCIRCEETTVVTIPAKGHTYKAGTEVPATCTTSGYIPYECDCGESYNKLTSEPDGHAWKDTAESEKAATCYAAGEKVYKCKNCNETNKVIIPQLTHTFVWELVKNPTTTVKGLITGTCINDCGEVINIEIPAIDSGDITCTVTFIVNGEVFAVHTVAYGGGTTAPVNVPEKAPDANGHYSVAWDKNFDRVTDDIEVNAVYVLKAHTFGEWTTVEEAACNKTGIKSRECTVCGYEEIGTIETTDHNYKLSERKDPTCSENGYEDYICNDCNASKREIIRNLGHVMNYFEYLEATCTSEGRIAYFLCSRCGNKYADRLGREQINNTVISMKSHTIILIKGYEATCTTDGATDYVHCTVCGMTNESKVIPAYGHKDVNGDHVCDNCDGTYYEGGEQVCTCTCHKPGVLNELIFKIINFFWKLFGKNKSCACGKLHY